MAVARTDIAEPGGKKVAADALVCRIDRGGEQGGATFWYVRLPDGYLLDCGFDGLSEDRAAHLSHIVNRQGWAP